MKNLLITLLMLVSCSAYAESGTGPDTLAIHTNAVCDMCVKTIESELIYEKGVKGVKVDLEHNVILVAIDAKKTDLDKVRGAIVKLGYAADDQLPDMAAREKLPACCRKEGCGLPAPRAIPEQEH
jgi:mercuric ion binding protein